MDLSKQCHPTFIAEISSNHNRDLNRCFEFIKAAKEIGCDAVKFQFFDIANIFHYSILERSKKHRDRKEWELPIEFIPQIAKYCNELNIFFGCTPFDKKSVDFLNKYVDFFKISSYELIWLDLIHKCARTNKTLILSTGMATLSEVTESYKAAVNGGCTSLALLHCVSGYPTPLAQCNLKCINTLKNEFKCHVGWSDHSVSETAILRAIQKWSAEIIEFHLDTDGQGAEFKLGHCWLPREAKKLINKARTGIILDGDGIKKPRPIEIDDRNWRADPTDGLRPIKSIRERD